MIDLMDQRLIKNFPNLNVLVFDKRKEPTIRRESGLLDTVVAVFKKLLAASRFRVLLRQTDSARR